MSDIKLFKEVSTTEKEVYNEAGLLIEKVRETIERFYEIPEENPVLETPVAQEDPSKIQGDAIKMIDDQIQQERVQQSVAVDRTQLPNELLPKPGPAYNVISRQTQQPLPTVTPRGNSPNPIKFPWEE